MEYYINSRRNGGSIKHTATETIYYRNGKSVKKRRPEAFESHIQNWSSVRKISATTLPATGTACSFDAQCHWHNHKPRQAPFMKKKWICNIVFWRKNPSKFNDFYGLWAQKRFAYNFLCFPTDEPLIFILRYEITIIIWRLHATLATNQITEHVTKLNGEEESTSQCFVFECHTNHHVILWLSFLPIIIFADYIIAQILHKQW